MKNNVCPEISSRPNLCYGFTIVYGNGTVPIVVRVMRSHKVGIYIYNVMYMYIYISSL